MAPIQNQCSYSMQSSSVEMTPTRCHSSFEMTPTICRCGEVSESDWEWLLPVSRRGHFFQDSFFEDFRSHFDTAVRQVLQRWGQMDVLNDTTWHGTSSSSCSSLVNNLNRYRQLRSCKSQPENQEASTVVSDNDTHKIVTDVHDVMEGDIKVKVLGEKEVLVEGQRKTQSHSDEGFLSSQNKFSRCFTFPTSINMAAVTSVLSSDGVLTIEAPKRRSEENTTVNESHEQTPKRAVENNCKSPSAIHADSVGHKDTNDKTFYCKGCNKRIRSLQKDSESMSSLQEGLKIPIKINSSSTKNQQSGSFVQESQSKEEHDTRSIEIEIERKEEKKIGKEEEEEKEEEEINKEDKVKNKSLDKENEILTQTKNELQTSSFKNKNSLDIPIILSSTSSNSLPITRRGLFFNDSIFKDIRKDFQSAVQEILSKWGLERSSSSFMEDDLTSYRNLRIRDLKEETQAVKSTEDNSSHKFVLDVQDFLNGGEVTVKAISDRELVIEGHVEKQEEEEGERRGSFSSSKRFLKRFLLPGDIELDSVTSVMSSDGVLTITAPKKRKTSFIQHREVTIPVSIEGRREKDEEDDNNKENNRQSSRVSSSSSSPDIDESTTCNNSSSVDDFTSYSSKSQGVISNKAKTPNEHIIPVNVEGECCDAKKKSLKSHLETQSPINEKTFENSQNRKEKPSHESTKSQANFKDQNMYSRVMGNKAGSSLKQTDYCRLTQQEKKSKSNKGTNLQAKDECLSSPSVSRYLPISRRGLFFDDSFFQDYQKDFQAAVRDVLVKSRQCVSGSDNMAAYRSLRQRELKVENQAMHLYADQDSLKVVLDVKDFINGDVTVSIDGDDLVIEGRAENHQAESTNSLLTFSHRFLLPKVVDPSSITSAISSDGILIVISPKKGNCDPDDSRRKISNEVKSRTSY